MEYKIIRFSSWNTRYWCFRFARKSFLSMIFLKINVRPSNELNLDSRNNLLFFYDWAPQSRSPYCGIRYWCFGFARKVFLYTIFLIIKVHLQNKINLKTHNNLNSFCYWHKNHVLHTSIHDIDALDLQEKLFFPPFSL